MSSEPQKFTVGWLYPDLMNIYGDRGNILTLLKRAEWRGLNDRKADGTDVSWIWDVDFEQLKGKAKTIIPAGTRAHDLAVRLKYAGIEHEDPQTDPSKALDLLIKNTSEDDTAYLLTTYTAMLDLRAELVRRGWAQPYWET